MRARGGRASNARRSSCHRIVVAMRVALVLRLIAFVACAVVTYVLGDGLFRRMAVPQGIDLVAVDDAPRVAGPSPRHVVLVVVDGLGAIDAARVPTMQRLAENWP